jgi:mediator of RNA polymerase II transcription subunit 5
LLHSYSLQQSRTLYADDTKGDHTIIAVELITAAFDVVSHAMYHHESAQTAFIFRSFLVQKLPILLSFLSESSLGTLPTEYCITQALSRIDPNAFPPFSQTFDPMRSGNIQLSDVRQEFLFACALHRLIPEESIVRLLGEDPMASLPTQLVKQNLIEQINASSERAEQLIDDLESMNGNAGVIVDALTEVQNLWSRLEGSMLIVSEAMHNLCTTKETMTLKSICSFLARKPQIFDVMLLFRSPPNILQPLCSLLDEWRWDDDIGKHAYLPSSVAY